MILEVKTDANHLLSRPIHQLLVELQQVEPVFGLSSFHVHLAEELPDHDDGLRKTLLIGVVFGRMFIDSFQ